MDKQTKEAKEMVKQMPFKERARHFWNYYKIQTIVAVFVSVLIGITVYQIITREEYDLEIEYYGERLITEEQAAALENYLKDYIEDANGDGEVSVYVTRTGSLEEMGAGAYGNMKFMAELAAGQYQIYILNENMYKMYKDSTDNDVSSQSFDMRDNPKCIELLGITDADEPMYWCIAQIPDSEREKDEVKVKIKNAENATKVLLK